MISSVARQFKFANACAFTAVMGSVFTLVGLLFSIEPTLNQCLAILFSAVILTTWFYDKFTSVIIGLVFFISKPFWMRLVFGFDSVSSINGGFDLLGIMPALIFAALIILQIYSKLARGEKICPDRARILLMAFSIVGFLSIFLPSNSITVGMGGFERNILPNMMISFLLADIIYDRQQIIIFVKTLLVIGLFSNLYGIGQYIAGIYPWELAWFQQTAINNGLTGWLTIGLRGIEFRIFSIFYSYMDFFFTSILIYAFAAAFKGSISGGWRKLRILYFISFYIILILSLERMPLVMALAVTIILHYLSRPQQQKKKIVWAGLTGAVIIYGSLILASPILNSTGAAKLVRLAELANPFKASSIDDRVQNKWGPALETIKSNPLGVGIGFGSQTKASEMARDSENYVQPHNELIQKTLEMGIVGGIIYFLLSISLFKFYRIISKSEFEGRLFGYAMIAGTVAFWICSLVNLPFSGTSGIVYWALAGVALAIKDGRVSMRQKVKSEIFKDDKKFGHLAQIETPHLA